MKIKRLIVHNYKLFSELDLMLQQRLNVFVGINGAGKTSLLEAIATLLSWYTDRFKSPTLSTSGWKIGDWSIRNGAQDASLELYARIPQVQDEVVWNESATREGHNQTGGSNRQKLNEAIKLLRSGLESADAQGKGVQVRALPVIAYYSTNRAVLDIPRKIRTRHSFEILEAYDGAMNGSAHFREFFEWFRDHEDIENDRARKEPSFRDRQLEAVREALSKCMPGYRDWRVCRYNSPVHMEVRKDGVDTPVVVDTLSDGEKCLLAMVGDMARRLAIANPDAAQPLSGSGVVLIDEIELHLHPGWQQRVIPSLLAAFPNIQFLITTHSPQVISSVDKDCLYAVSDGVVGLWNGKTQTKGIDANQLLVDVFNTPPSADSEQRQRLDEYAMMLESGSGFTEEGERIYRELLRYFGEGDPVMALVTYRREILGRDEANA